MPTIKVRRPDGLHCFYCNARVEEEAKRCPACGREFAGARAAPVRRSGRVGERLRSRMGPRRRGYLPAVIVLAALAVVSGLVFRGRAEGPAFPRPDLPEVGSTVFETREHPAERVERRSVFARVRPGLPRDSLRAALDWLLYRTVDERNRVESGNLRVVWAYLFESDTCRPAEWRARVIWQGPGVPEARRPLGIGEDRGRVSAVRYDYAHKPGQEEREELR